jgi:hypothetical protein
MHKLNIALPENVVSHGNREYQFDGFSVIVKGE